MSSAMVLVSLLSFAPDHASQQPGAYRDPRVGILLILLSCLVQGSQYVFEEKLMRLEEGAAKPMLIVGMEGLWGSILMPAIVLPWAALLDGSDAGGCMENTTDTIAMMRHSVPLQWMILAYLLSVFFYNIFAIYVTYYLNSVWHAILENFRPSAIWIVDLLLYYVFTRQLFGEAWTRWSYLELTGMAVMILGTAIFNGSIRIAGCEYPVEAELHSAKDGSKVIKNEVFGTGAPFTHSPAFVS
jgi:hypothetical protein